jgi:DNA-directed RNA polymerase subunit M/transcription elongation factor TFIIS
MAMRNLNVQLTAGLRKKGSAAAAEIVPTPTIAPFYAAPVNQAYISDLDLIAAVPQEFKTAELIPDLIAMAKEGRLADALSRADPRDPRSIIFNDRTQDEFREEEKLEKDVIQGKTKQVLTNIICWNKKCKQKAVIEFELQIHSGDEGATVFYSCTACGFQKRK